MPAMKVSGDSEAEGEPEAGDAESVSGGDTERSGGSSRPDRDSSAEEADEPDSDDSSEMDESECERRRNACLENIANMERQFMVLREQLFRERINQVEYQLTEVRGGRSQEYLGPLQQLQENMRTRIEVAGVLRQLRIENIKHHCDAEELAALQNLNVSTSTPVCVRIISKVSQNKEYERALETLLLLQLLWTTGVEECKARWKNIRNSYSRHVRNKMSARTTGKHHKPYYLKKHLNFIKSFISFRNVEVNKVNGDEEDIANEIAEEESDSNIDTGILKVEIRRNSEESEQDYEPEANNSTGEYSFPKAKNAPQVFETAFVNTDPNQQRAEDADMSFLKSVLPDMTEMNQNQKRRFKIGVLKLCGDILSETQ